MIRLLGGLAWEKSFEWAVKQERLLKPCQCWVGERNIRISVLFLNRILQVIQDDALTFGSQQIHGFVVTFRSFLKGDDDKYVVIFRCK